MVLEITNLRGCLGSWRWWRCSAGKWPGHRGLSLGQRFQMFSSGAGSIPTGSAAWAGTPHPRLTLNTSPLLLLIPPKVSQNATESDVMVNMRVSAILLFLQGYNAWSLNLQSIVSPHTSVWSTPIKIQSFSDIWEDSRPREYRHTHPTITAVTSVLTSAAID